MSETNETSSSSPLPPESTVASKLVVVRVRRRSSQARLDAFWLEINEKPAKRSFSDLEALSISDSSGKDIEKLKRRKLLVQHVETINNSEAAKDVLQSFLPDIGGTNSVQKKIEERRSKLNLDKKQEQLRSTARKKHEKQEQLRSTARKKHEDLVRNARFQQIWNSRRGKEANDEVLHEMCHLYDVVRVDNVEENYKNAEKTKSEGSYNSLEDNAILCNYLPLLREFIPSAAEEIEFNVTSSLPKEENYVYDLYTVEDGVSENVEHPSTEYPLVQVDHEDDYYDGPDHSDYETDDSNAEDNPNNDYPDEESSEDEGRGEMDLYDEDVERSQYEDEEVYVSEEEENQKWDYR